MASEINSLAFRLDSISEKNRKYRDFTRQDLVTALQELIACFPVYRTYIQKEGNIISERDQHYIKIALEKALKKAKWVDPSLFNFLQKVFSFELNMSKEETQLYRDFILRFQQLTGPIMAKGLEDTTFYIYNRFISLNEVGGDPEHFGVSPDEFHLFNQKKHDKWPYGFLASSTHDTKRSEDVRLRLNVLSEIPHEWRLAVKKWALINAKYKESIHQTICPSPNTEYFLYQLLLGIWPLVLTGEEKEKLMERIWASVLKSLREARVETNWIKPNEEYENSVKKFVFSIMKDATFYKLFIHFLKKISRYGAWNSIAATALKLGSCGISEIYQGCELTNFSLVDPDNRREVDYDTALLSLKKLKQRYKKSNFAGWLKQTLVSQKPWLIKQYLYWKGLNFRKTHKELFLNGDYLPLKAEGSKKEHIVAYYRKWENEVLIVIVGRFYAHLGVNHIKAPLGEIWEDTKVVLPQTLVEKPFIDLFTNQTVSINSALQPGELYIKDVFTSLPTAFLYFVKEEA